MPACRRNCRGYSQHMISHMATTTIAVEVTIRDRLALHASRNGHTLGEEVQMLLEEREIREILAVGARIIADPRNAHVVSSSIAPAAAWADRPPAEVD